MNGLRARTAEQRERLTAGVLVVGAVLFAVGTLLHLVDRGGIDVLTLPMALVAVDVLIAAALVTRWYPLRPVAQGLAIFGALVHVLVLLRSGSVWTRGCSGLLAVAHCYALVLLFALTAREQDDDPLREAGQDRGDQSRPAEVPAEAGEPRGAEEGT